MSLLRIGVLFLLLDLIEFCELCPPEYYATDTQHSYCSEPFPNVVDLPISPTERAAIVRMHNHERRLVRGTNMEKMYWNDDLAEIALRYARRCDFDHDRAIQRTVPRIPLPTGQNLAMGYENWTLAIGGWIDEKEHYVYGHPATGVVGHYTQMIWHSAVLVGCAATLCPAYGSFPMDWPFYVCNYVTGQLSSDVHPPYTQGPENHFLHDCQGKVCLYNGTLDLKTCQCQCSTYATGPQCEHLDCSRLPPCYYRSTASCIAVNVPSECPRLCGLCDRYEVLKHVYGAHNLAPDTPTTKTLTTTTTTTPTATRKKAVGRKLKKKKVPKRPRIQPAIALRTVSTLPTSTHNSGDHCSPSLRSYLLCSFMWIIVTSNF